MNLPVNSTLASLRLWLGFWLVACIIQVANGSHILGVFVNLHRSQLLVHLAVARTLLQRGHQLTLVTTLPLEEDWLAAVANTTQVKHVLVPWQLPTSHELQQQQRQHNDNFITRLQWTLTRLELSGELLQQPAWLAFMQHVPTPRYDLLLLGYHFNEHLLGVAAHFDCPVAIISTQQPIGFIHSLMGNAEERWYVPQPYDSQQRTGFPALLFGLWEKSSEYLARRVMQRIYSVHFASPRYPSFEEMRRRVVLALNNHHMISEGPIGPVLPSMLDIGGIVMEQLSHVDAAFDKGLTQQKQQQQQLQKRQRQQQRQRQRRPFILFSLGTRFSWRLASKHLEQSFAAAFVQLPEYDIYWTHDGNDASGINLTHAHIKLAKWWPQSQLLSQPEAELFITHGGKGSLTEALFHGVPLLGLPLVGDQRANLRKMQNKGWGLTLDVQSVDQVQLLSAIRRMLGDAKFKQKIKKDALLYRDRPLNASYLAAYWLEYVIRHKGAKHLYSPARELDFWQYYLLDIRLVLYLLVALLTWLLWLIIRM
ncbi:UDP-glycosyltransferase UGT5 [Drosophila sulfurigaster albostrigata]|uniref:UDP-glycosyltransferase UGT5 n=1 Tax=Drosophila sulfurigaster albostrigata TaxID=89887 RepID=UPI002D21835A|nr:UDP-glycosyltransferase UGT5 [Drosophila sulfurigaster albostrigata]